MITTQGNVSVALCLCDVGQEEGEGDITNECEGKFSWIGGEHDRELYGWRAVLREKPAGPQKMPWTSSLLVLRIKERLRLVVYCSMQRTPRQPIDYITSPCFTFSRKFGSKIRVKRVPKVHSVLLLLLLLLLL